MNRIMIIILLVLGVFTLSSCKDEGETQTKLFDDMYDDVEGYTQADYERLEAVYTHINNVLENGRSTTNPTPLLADGINTLDGGYATWINPGGEKHPISNFASQQNFLRTLVAFSEVTGDMTFKNEAINITEYMFENFTHRNGLIHWGGHQFIDLETLEVVGPDSKNMVHELKNHYPYYELFAEVDAELTEDMLTQLWAAHVTDWEAFDMTRHGHYSSLPSYINNIVDFDPPTEDVVDPTNTVNDEWGKEVLILPDDASGLTFINAGSDLYYAAFMLTELTGNETPAMWGKYLARQYQLAKNPETGLPVYQFTAPKRRQTCSDADFNNPYFTKSLCGDRATRQFGDVFGPVAQEGNMLKSSAISVDSILMNLYIGEYFGNQDIIDWTIDTALAYYSHAIVYERTELNENIIRLQPMWNNGVTMLDYSFPRPGYYGEQGESMGYITMSEKYTLPMARAYQFASDLSERNGIWEIMREVIQSLGYGDIGTIDGEEIDMTFSELDLPLDSGHMIQTFVTLYEKTENIEYLNAARRVADNMMTNKFHRGYFLETREHVYLHIANPDILALITLDSAIKGRLDNVPVYLSPTGYVHGSYELPNKEVIDTRDTTIIYDQTRYVEKEEEEE